MMTQTVHPCLPPFSAEQLQRIIAERGLEFAAKLVAHREEMIRLDAGDPFRSKLEPEAWTELDEFLNDPEVAIVALFGANRTGKSWCAAKRMMVHLAEHPGLYLAMSAKEESSIAQQQKILWHFTPQEWKAQNSARAKVAVAINYTAKNGFADGKVIWPNGSELYCVTYRQEPDDYEGWEFGARDRAPVVGVWADESMPLKWLQMFERRIRFGRGAKLLWTFTPIRGLTPAMKEFLGASPDWVRSKVADLLPTVALPGLPRGHMPTVAVPWMKRSRAVWWHIGANPFGNYTAEVNELCKDKATEYVERVAYGYGRDTAMRAFPLFGPANVIADEAAPTEGTDVQILDPAGARKWSCLWVRVSPGNPPDYTILADWPDEQTYGEWAVTSERETNADSKKGWGGDIGPAQAGLGWGPELYKAEFLRVEQRLGLRVKRRLIDPRAGAAPDGEMTLIDRLAEGGGSARSEVRSPKSEGGVPGLFYEAASGVREEEGIIAIEGLLEWNPEQPMVWPTNRPRLFVCRRARQVIWALSNYTRMSLGDPKAPMKDFVDLVRYLATGDLWHVGEVEEKERVRWGGY